MLSTLAIENYRSLRHVVLPLGRLNVVTGANGSGKSNLYRALRLLAESSRNGAVAALAREGGLPSTLWAGPENLSRAMRAGEQEVQGTRRRGPVSLRLGFASDDYGYAIDLGLPVPGPPPDGRAASAFDLDPEIKRECTWSGPVARPATMLTDRRGGLVQVRADDGSWQQSTYRLNSYDSMLSELSDPERAPEVLALRERIRAWRFYDHFRTDARAPARAVQIGTRTPVLGHDGADLAAAWQTIVEVGDTEALYAVLELAFPGSTVEVRSHDGLFSLQLGQPGMLRPLTVAELSDGTLRFLLLVAALLTPRPPELMVLNEPESSLHPDLLPGLAQLVVTTARRTQIVVVSHSRLLLDALADASRSGDADLTSVELVKELGQTTVVGQDRLGRNTVELAATVSAPPAPTAYVHTDDGRGPAVEFLAPTTWADALAARSEHPGAVPIAGGTDVMVELNFDRHRPDVLIDLTRVPELREWSRGDDGGVRLGAGVSFARVMTELADTAPGLAMASRTVGSPQIRARGTVGGNLGSASPAGDAHPVLLAVDAVVEVESVRGVRQVPVADFFTGVKKSALEPDELISAVLLPPVAGPQQFAKIGTRNAMVIAVTSFGLALHPERQAVGAAIGSAAPTPRHARTAEAFLAGALADQGLWESRSAIPDLTATRFGDLVAADASPIDDVRGTAAYRRHALSVLARRTLGWAWQDYQREEA